LTRMGMTKFWSGLLWGNPLVIGSNPISPTILL
jgi:hypothetical protein